MHERSIGCVLGIMTLILGIFLAISSPGFPDRTNSSFQTTPTIPGILDYDISAPVIATIVPIYNNERFVVKDNNILYGFVKGISCQFVAAGFITFLTEDASLLQNVRVVMDFPYNTNSPSIIYPLKVADRVLGWSALLPHVLRLYDVWLIDARTEEVLSPQGYVEARECNDNFMMINFDEVPPPQNS